VGAIKEIGTKQFKAGNNLKALEKYRKGCNYLEDYFPDDLDDDELKTLVDLKVSLYLNVALTSIKLGVGDTAIKAASEALEMEGLGPREKAKAYYRRGNGYLLVKNEEDAIADLEMAKSFAPSDSAIVALLKKAYETRAQRKKNQKAAMAKLFAKNQNLSGIFSDNS
jgi:peptidyl-prolyl isomerase D